ncbi:hypothetical protein D3C84_231570 [compost metagenome]
MAHIHCIDLRIDRIAARHGRRQQILGTEPAGLQPLDHGPGIQAQIVTGRQPGVGLGIGKAPEQAGAERHGTSLEYLTARPARRRHSLG